jgi:hypothetical protein
MAIQQSNPDQAAWSIKSWCADLDISPAYAYELISAGRVESVKLGGKRLIVTSPKDFIARLAEEAA